MGGRERQRCERVVQPLATLVCTCRIVVDQHVDADAVAYGMVRTGRNQDDNSPRPRASRDRL